MEYLTQLVNDIKTFVAGTWDHWDEERSIRISDEIIRPTNQEQLITDLPRDLILASSVLRDLIMRGKLMTMDKDSMVIWNASGLFIRDDESIVVFHER